MIKSLTPSCSLATFICVVDYHIELTVSFVGYVCHLGGSRWLGLFALSRSKIVGHHEHTSVVLGCL